LIGASVKTYLLEKVRIISQSPNERNFHIFYLLGCGGNAAQHESWRLGPDDSWKDKW